MVTDVFAVKLPEVDAVAVPVVDPAEIVMLEETMAAPVLLLESATVTFWDGAAESVTATVADCPATTMDGLTATDDKAGTVFGVTAWGVIPEAVSGFT